MPMFLSPVPSAQPEMRAALCASETARHVSSQALLDGSRELVIHHQGNTYRLRLTRNDKLILTK